MKRIVICCDGTWNSPDETDQGVPVRTNVVKVAQAVTSVAANGVAQRMYYDPGIGSSGGIMNRAFDGAAGSGLSRNVQEACRFLITTYEPGDELYFLASPAAPSRCAAWPD